MSANTEAKFQNTLWTEVGQAGAGQKQALQTLLTRYWPPLYAFLRRQGHSKADAEDLTQGFVGQLLSNDGLRRAAKKRGKFRSFLLAGLQNFARNERDKVLAEKRGGKLCFIPIDTSETETYLGINPADHEDPAVAFEKDWAMSLLSQARAELKNQFAQNKKTQMFEALAPLLSGDRGDYKNIAVQLGMNEGAVRTAVHRFREDYGKILRSLVATTVETESEVGDEIRYLLSVLARG